MGGGGISSGTGRDPKHASRCLMRARPVQSTRSAVVSLLLERLMWVS
jgi:hypothetical protein